MVGGARTAAGPRFSARAGPRPALGAILAVLLASSSQARADDVGLDDLVGEWLSAGYLERLEATRSPAQAADDGLTAFVLDMDGPVYRWLRIYGFHEAVTLEVEGLEATGEPGAFLLIVGDGDESGIGEVRLEIGGGAAGAGGVERLTLHEGDGRPEGFVRAEPSLEEHINRIVLAGSYVDALGRSLQFSAAGEAVWPGGALRYRLHLDGEADGCDTLTAELDAGPRDFGFKREADRLELYELPGDEPASCTGSPSLVLTRTE
ncbi:MAG TPA: hypothetical protein VFG47_22330 [Geminicoccaceae bacterium]|nr:hypothetical protein [Geminicoccaceae bacterium]